ncbi:MAG: hypothetical protein ACPGRX_01545 [Bdellovibrionales bacterium]
MSVHDNFHDNFHEGLHGGLHDVLDLMDLPAERLESVRAFDGLCDALLELTDQENEYFMADVFYENKEISMRKIELLAVFEEQSRALFALITGDFCDHLALQAYFVEKIQLLQDKLKVNTSLQLHAMGQIQGRLMGEEAREQCH